MFAERATERARESKRLTTHAREPFFWNRRAHVHTLLKRTRQSQHRRTIHETEMKLHPWKTNNVRASTAYYCTWDWLSGPPTSGTPNDSWPKLKKDSSLAMVSLNPHLPIFRPSPGAEAPVACRKQKAKRGVVHIDAKRPHAIYILRARSAVTKQKQALTRLLECKASQYDSARQSAHSATDMTP